MRLHPLLVVLLLAPSAAALDWYSALANETCACAQDAFPPCCSVVRGRAVAGALAWAAHADEVDVDGWGKLRVHGAPGSDRPSDPRGSFAMGYLEGFLTARRIGEHFLSWWDYQFGPGAPEDAPAPPEVVDFINAQDAWASAQVYFLPADAYWRAAGSVLAQFDGILAGQNAAAGAAATRALSRVELLLLEAAGDLYDIVPAVTARAWRWDDARTPFALFEERRHAALSCSALVRLVDAAGAPAAAAPRRHELFAGHTTWTTYQNMLRAFKHYQFPSGRRMSFSAKPGVVYSKDDFHVLGAAEQRLVVIETTNGVLNDALYAAVVPQALLTWQRVPLACRVATGGEEWTRAHARYNSGTYNNQYFVVDYKRFEPNATTAAAALRRGALWISEQLPGLVKRHDVTDVLAAQGFWAAYNIPWDDEIYNASGYRAAYERFGDAYSHANCTRARIFAARAPNVSGLDAAQRLLRYNRYDTDPLCSDAGADAIAARSDLREGGGTPSGGIDSKVTSWRLVVEGDGAARAQSGPTHDDQPVFDWAQFPSTVRLGQPDRFDFPWVDMQFDDEDQ